MFFIDMRGNQQLVVMQGVQFGTGGTDNPLNYLLLFVSVMAMSAFFSVHYLTCYYLLQPYNAGTEIVGGTYKIVTWVTYIVCFMFMKLRMSTLVFGTVVTCFCLLYCVAR